MPTDDTKATLLKAAKELLLERGYAGASVRELVSAAGTNLGAVNYHFGSREKLLNQAILEFFLEWTTRVQELEVPADAGPLEQLAARARPMVEGIEQARPLFVMVLVVLLESRHSPELRRELAGHYARQRELAAEFIRSTDAGRELSASMA